MDTSIGVTDTALFIYIIVQLIYRIIITMIVTNRARNLNRSQTNWGVFAFVFPIFALVTIFFMKYKIVWPYSKDRVN